MVSAVVVNYNTSSLAAACVASLRSQQVVLNGRRGSEVFVVDNASRPAERERLADLGVTVIYNRDNRGYGAAINQVLQHTAGEFILFSNPDALYTPRALQALVDGFVRLPRCGAVGPRLWWDIDRTFLLPPGDPVTLSEQLGAALMPLWPWAQRRRERRWLRRTLAYWASARPMVQTMLSGACILTHRRVLDTCGGFDERFHLYYEDTDWCRRVRSEGYCLFFVPDADATHMYNQSARQDRGAADCAAAASFERYIRKHYGRWGWRLLRRVTAMAASLADGARQGDGYVDLGTTVDAPQRSAPARGAGRFLIQVSPSPTCIPALAQFRPEPTLSLPPGAWKQLAPGEYFARVFALPDLRPIARWRWRKAEG